MALLITLVVGMFTLIGSIIVLLTRNNQKVIDFSISIGFGVLVSLIILELIPESFELLSGEYGGEYVIIIMILLVLLGIIVLKILDRFIPDHEVNHKDNLIHIGVMTSVALFIHNLLEGMAVYTSLESSLKLGSLLGIGVALHNIPLGMSITSFAYRKGKYKALLLSLLVSLSTFIGGFITFLFADGVISGLWEGIILTVTLGMLIYIIIFELLPHIIENKKKVITYIGIIVGILLLFISTLFE